MSTGDVTQRPGRAITSRMSGLGNEPPNNHPSDGATRLGARQTAGNWGDLSARRTLSLLDIVKTIDPTMTAARLPGAVRDVLGVLEARNIHGSLRQTIDLNADAPLFAQPELRITTGAEVPEFEAAWRFAIGCTAVSKSDLDKLAFLSRQVDRGAKITDDERPVLASLREQITYRGIGRGFLTDPERSLLNDFWNFRTEFLEAERRQRFFDLGLEWREKDGRLEPAKIDSKFKNSTFCSLSSHYFRGLLATLGTSPSDATADLRARYDELRRIYLKAQKLSELRESGKPGESSRGWDDFLRTDLYPRYGLGSPPTPF